MDYRLARLILLLSLTAAAEDPPPLARDYAGDKFKLQFNPEDKIRYTGTITLGEQKFPLRARQTENGVVGEFEANGKLYPIIIYPKGDEITVSTGGANYTLKKVIVNPFGKEAGPNPDPTKTAPAKTPSKDPLAYQVLQLPGGTAAKFDNWQYTQIMSAPNAIYCDAMPAGRALDFVLRTYVATPAAQDMQNLFVVGPQLAQATLNQLFGPVFKASGEPKKCTAGGDEAMIEQYAGEVQGAAYTCRIMYVKRKDVAVAVMAIGTEAGFKEFGRAVEIVAQSITLKESTVEPGLLGTWTKETGNNPRIDVGDKDKINVSQTRSITFYPNGTFSDTAQSGFSGRDFNGLAKGADRGTVVKRGNALTFHYDDGKTWTAPYELYSNGLKLDGQIYLK